jgi:uncharacterized protein YndB with AHSA1/START domain
MASATKAPPRPRPKREARKASTNKVQVNASDQAVKKATGKTWDQWCRILDDAGCAKMNHKQIVTVVERHYSGGWWGQMVTVGYEQARGLRELHQKCDGDYQASSSKTVNVPVARLFDAWNDPKLRSRWLRDGDGLVIRKATKPKSLRITWTDGITSVDVNLFPKGNAKSYVSMQHTKLKDAKQVQKMKALWAQQLERMKSVLEA